jgi:glycosyltransferase involved in cell wall biosynthesis
MANDHNSAVDVLSDNYHFKNNMGDLLLKNILPTQDDIVSCWKNKDHCVVSVCMLTYNHEKYVRQAIEGVLLQETDFCYELLVHDDASSDKTADIIREYQEKYPLIVKPILQTTNQYSKGINPSVLYNYTRATGDYVAWCEGDDYWIEPNKLEKQISAMRANPGINLSVHSAIRIDCSEYEKLDAVIGRYSNYDCIVPFPKVIHRSHGWIPTASTVVTQEVKQKLLHFMQTRPYITAGEFWLRFFGAANRGAIYFAKPMSVYRFGTESSWTRRVCFVTEEKNRHELSMIRGYFEIDTVTGHKYSLYVKRLIVQRIVWLFKHDKSMDTDYIGRLQIGKLYSFYKNYMQNFAAKIYEINALNRQLIIFGAGSGCAQIMDYIDPEKVLCIIDRDSELNGSNKSFEFERPLDSVSNLYRYKGFLLLVSVFGQERETLEQLFLENGIPLSDAIFIYYDLFDCFELNDLLLNDGTLPFGMTYGYIKGLFSSVYEMAASSVI